jgi:hypothetical protein
MPASRSVVSQLHHRRETFLYTLKAGPAGGRRPPSGRQPRHGHRGAGLTHQPGRSPSGDGGPADPQPP